MESAKQFNKIVNEETIKLETLRLKWQNILESPVILTEDLRAQIRTVVGQTNLLINEKMQQFRNLIKNYESGRGDVDITLNDLEGFWDLVLIQVNELTEKFSELEINSLDRKRR